MACPSPEHVERHHRVGLAIGSCKFLVPFPQGGGAVQDISAVTPTFTDLIDQGAVKFLNENGYVHGNIRLPSIYTTESGEWRVGGFEALSLAKEYNEVIYVSPLGEFITLMFSYQGNQQLTWYLSQSHASLVPDLTRFAPPEVVNNGWDVLKQNPITAIDAYGLGLLIAEIFNNGITSVTQLSSIQTIPANILPHQKRLVVHNPKSRLSADGFLQIGNRPNGFFRNPLVELTDSLEQLDLQDSETKQSVMRYVLLVSP